MGRERKLKRTEFTRLSESTGFRLAPSTRRVFESMAKTRSCTLRGKTPQATSSPARRSSSASSRNFFHYQNSSSVIHTRNSGRFFCSSLQVTSCVTSVDLPPNCQTLAEGFAFSIGESLKLFADENRRPRRLPSILGSAAQRCW